MSFRKLVCLAKPCTAPKSSSAATGNFPSSAGVIGTKGDKVCYQAAWRKLQGPFLYHPTVTRRTV